MCRLTQATGLSDAAITKVDCWMFVHVCMLYVFPAFQLVRFFQRFPLVISFFHPFQGPHADISISRALHLTMQLHVFPHFSLSMQPSHMLSRAICSSLVVYVRSSAFAISCLPNTFLLPNISPPLSRFSDGMFTLTWLQKKVLMRWKQQEEVRNPRSMAS